MARGKKYDTETKEKALALLATCPNVDELARELGLPASTLHTWRVAAEKDEDFRELRTKKKAEFVQGAWKNIEIAMKLGTKRVKRALEHEDALDTMIEEIEQGGELKPASKQALIQKLKTLQVQGLRDISTYIGTLYDKQALAAGDATGRQEVTGKNGEPLQVVILPEVKRRNPEEQLQDAP